jgi:prefoldin beta subunit
MKETIPPAAQQLLLQLSTFQQSASAIALQREGLALQRAELERAIKELGNVKEKEEVYKAVGPILVKSAKARLQRELTERKETTELRLRSLEEQEKRLKAKVAETQRKLQELLK